MKIKTKYKNQSRQIELSENFTVKNLLEKMKINPETVLVIRKNTVIPENEPLKDKDEVELLLVVSGG